MVLFEILKLLHYTGVAWGVGGATVATILMIKSEKDPESAPHLMKLMPAISKLVWAAIILLFISGIALGQLISHPVNTAVLAVKHIIVAILVLNGINLTFRILPKMQKLAPKTGKPSEEFLKAKKNAKLTGILGLVMWYAVLVLSVIM